MLERKYWDWEYWCLLELWKDEPRSCKWVFSIEFEWNVLYDDKNDCFLQMESGGFGKVLFLVKKGHINTENILNEVQIEKYRHYPSTEGLSGCYK